MLELLDPQRFTRGGPIEAGSEALSTVMVRRLKRELQEGALGNFPKRHVVRIALSQQGQGLTQQYGQQPVARLCVLDCEELPELALSKMLAMYTVLRQLKQTSIHNAHRLHQSRTRPKKMKPPTQKSPSI